MLCCKGLTQLQLSRAESAQSGTSSLSLEPAVDLQHFPSIKSHRWIHESMRKSLISSWGSSASPLAGAGSALLSDAHVEFFLRAKNKRALKT